MFCLPLKLKPSTPSYSIGVIFTRIKLTISPPPKSKLRPRFWFRYYTCKSLQEAWARACGSWPLLLDELASWLFNNLFEFFLFWVGCWIMWTGKAILIEPDEVVSVKPCKMFTFRRKAILTRDEDRGHGHTQKNSSILDKITAKSLIFMQGPGLFILFYFILSCNKEANTSIQYMLAFFFSWKKQKKKNKRICISKKTLKKPQKQLINFFFTKPASASPTLQRSGSPCPYPGRSVRQIRCGAWVCCALWFGSSTRLGQRGFRC